MFVFSIIVGVVSGTLGSLQDLCLKPAVEEQVRSLYEKDAVHEHYRKKSWEYSLTRFEDLVSHEIDSCCWR
jgi:hypothetical protein